jgi:hypothetical protein
MFYNNNNFKLGSRNKELIKENSLFYLNNLNRPLIPIIKPLSFRTYKTLSEDTSKHKFLAHDVLNHFLITLQNNNKIIPKVNLSKQGKLALETLTNMISLLENRNTNYLNTKGNCTVNSNENKLLKFIREYYKLPIFVLTKELNGNLYSEFEFNLPVKIPINTYLNLDDNNIFLTKHFTESGLYIFRHNTGKIALGLAMNFQRRLIDHMNSFKNHRVQEKLHKFAQDNGGIKSFT